MTSSEQIIRISGVVADLMTILGVGGVLTYGAFTRDKNRLGRTIFNAIVFAARLAIVLVGGFFLFMPFLFVRIMSLQILGASESYWEQGKELQHVLAYIVPGLIFVPVLALFGLSVFSASLYYPKLFLKTLFGSFFDFDLSVYTQHRTIEILEATYGSDINSFDVTYALRGMIENGRLRIIVSNSLAGDPHPGVRKDLTVRYRIDGIERTISRKERELLEIPELSNDAPKTEDQTKVGA